MYQSYLKHEDLPQSPQRLQLIITDSLPEIKSILIQVNDMEIINFILAEFEFWKWDLQDIDSHIWLMKVRGN